MKNEWTCCITLHEICVSVRIKVERIKERVEEKEGIPPQQQRLIYSGKQMWVSIRNHHPLRYRWCIPSISHLPSDPFLSLPGTMRRRLRTTRSREAQCSISCWPSEAAPSPQQPVYASAPLHDSLLAFEASWVPTVLQVCVTFPGRSKTKRMKKKKRDTLIDLLTFFPLLM